MGETVKGGLRLNRVGLREWFDVLYELFDRRNHRDDPYEPEEMLDLVTRLTVAGLDALEDPESGMSVREAIIRGRVKLSGWKGIDEEAAWRILASLTETEGDDAE